VRPDTDAEQDTQFVFRQLEEILRLFGRDTDPRWWWILVPAGILIAGVVYLIFMCRRKKWPARWVWVSFLVVLKYKESIMPPDTNTEQESQFVFRRLEEALRFFGRETDPRWFWIFVLGLVLIVGFAYVIVMYRRDSQSVGWLWATFLGALRCTVYVVLAAVFLLPSWQTWERTETHSKAVMALDVSGSMGSKDDPPTATTKFKDLPTRQDKVIVNLLTDNNSNFLRDLTKKNPVFAYRFGARIDDEYQLFGGDRPVWAREDWDTWLKPNPKMPLPEGLSDEEKTKFFKRLELLSQLVGGTSLADSLQEIKNHQSSEMLQGIIVISDGRSTQGSGDTFEQVREWSKRSKVPIFTVVVGEYRQPISISIEDLQAPEQTRPDDKFPVRLEINGEGLPNQERTVYLEITNPKGEKKELDPRTFKFNAGQGGPPHAQVEYEIDAALLGIAPATPGKKPELEEGEWTLQARIAADPKEIFDGKWHRSEKATVRVVKRPLRVLLFADAATRDYQFIRNMLVREMDQFHRVEVSICLQSKRDGVVQDVGNDRLFKEFPSRIGDDNDKAEDRFQSLSQYDLIIAFDPKWHEVPPEALANLEKWVYMHAGGLILIAGPVNTYQIANPANKEAVKPIRNLFPVFLDDSRIQEMASDRSMVTPYRLNFPGATNEMEFLKLDEEGKEQLGGWEEFFTGHTRAEAVKDAPLVRGIFEYYPVNGVKPSGTIVATFGDPQLRIGREGKQEMPYLVTMPYGNGKVVYLGSGEMWRLRGYREVYHERFWTKLGRYAGSGNLTRLNKRGSLVMGQKFPAGRLIHIEAQLLGRDLKPLSDQATPKLSFKAPAGANLPPVPVKPKPHTSANDWNGWFEANFRTSTPGEYKVEMTVPEGGEPLHGRFTVIESNPELENIRPDFGQMYQLASPYKEVEPRLTDRKEQEELKQALENTRASLLKKGTEERAPEAAAPAGGARKDAKEATSSTDDAESLRLFFDLNTAKYIPRCMVTDTKTQRSRGPVKDFWDQGFTLWSDPKMEMAYVLLLVAILLSAEWLTRKLLKLA
jgi:hypothetical protein